MADLEFDRHPLLQIDALGESIWGSYHTHPSLEAEEREIMEFWDQAYSCSEPNCPPPCSEPDPTGQDNNFDTLYDEMFELEYDPDRSPSYSEPDRPPTSSEPDRSPTSSEPDRPPTSSEPDRPPTSSEPDRPPTSSEPDHPPTSSEPDHPPTSSEPDPTRQDDNFDALFAELSELECNLLASNQLSHKKSVLEMPLAKCKRFAPTPNVQEMLPYLR